MAFPLKNFSIDEDSPLYEVRNYIEGGYTVPLAYEGWSEHLLVPMADEIINLIQGTIDQEELLLRFDQLSVQFQEDPESGDYATLTQELSQEQAARLSAMAMIEATGADVCLLSLGGITQDLLENHTGAQCGIFPGGIDDEVINYFRPWGTTLTTIELSGQEIQTLMESGRQLRADPEAIGTEYTYLDHVVDYAMPYTLTVREDADLESDQIYTVVFNGGDYSDDQKELWGDRLTVLQEQSTFTALVAWLEDNGPEISAESLQWK
jgi:2',3'-cyclic-nucleotide 2'-phosphodiesterase (5'-nucleotidase family)